MVYGTVCHRLRTIFKRVRSFVPLGKKWAYTLNWEFAMDVKPEHIDSEVKMCNMLSTDPMLGVIYFDAIIEAVLFGLFKCSTQGSRLRKEVGILGHVQAYHGMIEAQGKGTLHLHLLIWLTGNPTTDVLRHKMANDAE